MIQITQTKQTFKIKAGTKTVFELTEKETSVITDEQYKNCTSDETIKFFRRLGGSETVERRYTFMGYVPTQITSRSPDRQTKVIRTFSFEDLKRISY